MKNGISRKVKHGSFSVGLGAIVIAAVILLNALMTFLCTSNRLFIDMTTGHFREKDIPLYGGMYTLSDAAKNMMRKTFADVEANREGEDVKVDIIFCADPDLLCGNTYMRYIYYTALEMEKAFPEYIQVSTKDVWENPSSVNAYRTNSYSSIYQTNVIVASGTEFRVYNQRAFYTYSETTDTTPWAYNGEKTFLKGIIAVTKADSPIACLTTNHGEPFATEEGKAEYSAFVKVLQSAGYDVRFLNLEKDEIPENCRLIVTLDPQTDFLSNFNSTDPDAVSEIKKLDGFIAKAYSFMIFVDADTPKLTNLEEFLEEWGISFNRYEDSNGIVYDPDYALDGEGASFVGTYETEALGGSITEDMRKYGIAPKIVFSNVMGISYSNSYGMEYVLADETQGTGAFSFGYYSSNKITREIYDVFRSSETSLIYQKQNGVIATDTPDTAGNFKLMTLTRESRYIGEGQGYTSVNDASYVCAIGSTDFASNAVLSSNAYGNTDLLLEILRVIGREIEPVGIKFKPMYSALAGQQYVVEAKPMNKLAVHVTIPALICAVSGIVVLVRRKFRK
ncbi:MAG: hypothetical protein E7629_00145 [Ruminococcaceae bacterium]|nr:hypothetical protein [Oscillospiraceae bacterium]